MFFEVFLFYYLVSKTRGQVCNPGQYSVTGTEPCSDCPIGEISPAPEATSCFICSDGFYADPAHISCLSCEAGFYCVSGLSFQCPDGEISSPGATSCFICSAGTYADPSHTICQTCGAGFYCVGGLSYPCPADTYTAGTGSSQFSDCLQCFPDCATCVGGGPNDCTSCFSRAHLQSGGCVCDSGTYYAVPGDPSTCTSCFSNCIECTDGSGVPCIECDVGFYIFQGTSCVIDCAAMGAYYNDDMPPSSCASCTDADCAVCMGENSCDECESGYYLLNNNCYFACPVGYFDDEGAVPWQCTECSATYTPQCNMCDAIECQGCTSDYFLTPESICVEWTCGGIPYDAIDVCNTKGTCIEPATCDCDDANYFGGDCENCNGDFFCNGHSISCLNAAGVIICSCMAGWDGPFCDTCVSGWDIATDCTTPLCSPGCDPDHGSCSVPFTCDCDHGYTGALCTDIICAPGCDLVHGSCSIPYTCICDPGWDEATMCSTEIGCDHCASPDYCMGTDFCLLCEDGWFPPPLCDTPIIYCGAYRASEPAVCNGGTCDIDGTCSVCVEPFVLGPLLLCEYWTCDSVLYSHESVCGGHGECILDGTVSYCVCEGNWIDDVVSGDPCSVCDPLWTGPNCQELVVECVHGTRVGSKCECYYDDSLGYWDGANCERCAKNYFPNDDTVDACKTFCKVINEYDIPSGTCNPDGSPGECYQDFSTGWFVNSLGACDACVDHSHGDHRMQIDGMFCQFGFYAPSDLWFNMDSWDSLNPSPDHLRKLFFNEDYSSVFGYFASDFDYSGLCEDFIWPKTIIGEGCTLEIFSQTAERIYGASDYGADLGETISMLVITGLKNIRIGSTITLDIGRMEELFLGGVRRGSEQFEMIEVMIVQFEEDRTVFNVGYESPPPLLKSVRSPNKISMCAEDDSSVQIRVFAENMGDGSLHGLWYTATMLDPQGSSFNARVEAMYEHVNIDGVDFVGIPIVNELLLDVTDFKPASGSPVVNTIEFRVENIHQKTDAMTFDIETSGSDFIDVWVEGSKYYVFKTDDVDKALGSLVVRLYSCGKPLTDFDSVSFSNTVNKISGPEINMAFVDKTDPKKIDFFFESFSIFNVKYELEIACEYGGVPASDFVTVYPEAGDLVIVGMKSIQAVLPHNIVIDLRGSYDPVGSQSDDDSQFFWSCTPGCSLAIEVDAGGKMATLSGSEMPGEGDYTVLFRWMKGSRLSETNIHVTYRNKDFLGFNLIESFEEKEFCLNGVNFEEEFFYFYLDDRNAIGDPSFLYYFDNGYVDVILTLDNSGGSFGPFSYFREPSAFFIDDMYVRYIENRIGVIQVHHDPLMVDSEHQIVLRIHYSYFKEYLHPGDNVLTVMLEIDAVEESIVGSRTSTFVVHPVLHDETVLKSLIISKFGGRDPNQMFFDGALVLEEDPIYHQKVYTSFDFDDSMFDLEYSYEVMKKTFAPIGFYDGEIEFELLSVKKEKRITHINYNQPWAELFFGEVLPFPTSDGAFVYISLEDKERLVPGSEVLKVKSKKTGCVSVYTDQIDWAVLNNPLWMHDSSDIQNKRRRRNAELTFDLSPPFDVSPRTVSQQLALSLQQMVNLVSVHTYGGMGNDEWFLSEMNTLFTRGFNLMTSNPEVPSVSSYYTDLTLMELYSRTICSKEVEVLFDTPGVVPTLSTKFSEIIELQTTMIMYHFEFKSFGLLPNQNLNLIFNTVENVKFCAAKLKSGLDSLVAEADTLKAKFVVAMMNENVDNFDEPTALSGENEGSSTIDLFHSINLDNSMMYQLENSATSLKFEKEDCTKIVVSESRFNNRFNYFEDGGITPEDTRSDLVSSFVSLQTNNENRDLHSLSIEFGMAEQFENVMLYGGGRRNVGVKPYCFRYDKDGQYWEEKEAGSDCIGLSDFYSLTGGSVYCTYNGVEYDSDFVVIVEEFPGCIKRDPCPVEVSKCSAFVQHNIQRLTTSTSARVHVSSGFSDTILQDRRGEEDFKTIRSICLSEHVGIIVDANFKLWMFGSSELNDYLHVDKIEPIEISTSYWGNYQPKKCVCTRSSVFCLAYNPSVIVKTSRIYAFGRNDDLEIGKVNTEFELFAENVFDVQASRHTVYVTHDYTDSNGRYVVKARGMNHFGSLGTNNIAEYSIAMENVIVDEFPVGLIPEVIPVSNGVFFRFEHAIDVEAQKQWEYYYAGQNHPQSYNNERVPVVFNMTNFQRIDFVQRLYGEGPLYFISEGQFWVSGDVSAIGKGVNPNVVHSIHPHEFTDYQMGEFDESCRIFDFSCGFACYVTCINAEKDVLTYTWGKTNDGIAFDARCDNGICDKITLASKNLIGVVPGLGELAFKDEGLIEAFDFAYFESPQVLNIMDLEETYLFPPQIVMEQSGMENNVLTLTLKKPFVMGEMQSELRFVLVDKLDFSDHAHEVYIGSDNCIFPFYQDSHWTFWNQDEGAHSWDYYQISLPWSQFRDECGWRYDSMSDPDFDLYQHRLLFGENFYFGRSHGTLLLRNEDFLFDFTVRFPKKILKTSIVVEQNEFAEYWSFHVVDKSFDRSTRTGYVQIHSVSTYPNYFVFYDNIANKNVLSPDYEYPPERIDLDELSIEPVLFKLKECSIEELPTEANNFGDFSNLCNSKVCFQSYLLQFQAISDARVCDIPMVTFPINVVQFCIDPTSPDCLADNRPVSFRINLGLINLCSGELVENIVTTFTLQLFEDWTYGIMYEENHKFRIDDWLYFLATVESQKVEIIGTEIYEILFLEESSDREIQLYSSYAREGDWSEFVGLIIDDQISGTSVGFHFILRNELTDLQPSEEGKYHVVVKLEVLYRGNLNTVISDRRSQPSSQTIKISSFSLTVEYITLADAFSLLPYVVLSSIVFFVGVLSVMVLAITIALLVFKKGKRIKKNFVRIY